MNRHDRRAAAQRRRSAMGKLKLRCVACDRVGKQMTKEHIWPRWLAERADIKVDGIPWMGRERVSPSSATIPLCVDCNQTLGAKLEGPVSRLFSDLESGLGLSDFEAELFVRWLWKFEGLFWNTIHFSDPDRQYSDRWSVIERALGPGSMVGIRPRLSVAISLIEKNDDGFSDWPMGIDSGVSDFQGIFVSGVFCRTAVMILMSEFQNFVPKQFSVYYLDATSDEGKTEKVFFPATGFVTCGEAIETTKRASVQLARAHDEFAQQQNSPILIRRPRVEIP